MPSKDQKTVQVKNEEMDIFDQLRPRKGIKYRLSQTETNLDAGITKIFLKQTSVEYEPGQDLAVPPEDNVVVKKYNKSRSRGPVYKFYEEIQESKSRQKYLHKSAMALLESVQTGHAQQQNDKTMHDKIMRLIGPDWYVELSNKQFQSVDALKTAMIKDYHNNTIENTQDVLTELGLVLKPNHSKVKYALKKFYLCPVEFLLMLYKLCKTQYKNYTINDKLILSAVVHLTIRETLKEMHLRSPSPERKHKVHRKKVEKKKIEKCDSPYLQEFPFIEQKRKHHGIYTNKHKQYPTLKYFDYVHDMYDINYVVVEPVPRIKVDTSSKYGKPPDIPVRQLKSKTVRAKVLELKKPSPYQNNYCKQVNLGSSFPKQSKNSLEKPSKHLSNCSMKDNNLVATIDLLNNDDIEHEITAEEEDEENDLIKLYVNKDSYITIKQKSIPHVELTEHFTKTIVPRTEENMSLVPELFLTAPLENNLESCICAPSVENQKKEKFIYVNGAKYNICSCESINQKDPLKNLKLDKTDSCSCTISYTKPKISSSNQKIETLNQNEIQEKCAENLKENNEATKEETNEGIEEENKKQEPVKKKHVKCPCEKLFDQYLNQHEECLYLYELYQNKMKIELDGYMKDQLHMCTCGNSLETLQSGTSNTKTGNEPNQNQRKVNDDTSLQENSSKAIQKRSTIENCACEELRICGPKKCDINNKQPMCILASINEIPEEKEVDTKEEEEIEEQELFEEINPRIYKLEKFPDDPQEQMNLLKKLLNDLAKDQYPLALLPQSYLLPHFQVWLDKRSRKVVTMKDREPLMRESKRFWNHLARCHIESGVAKLPLPEEKLRTLTWKSAEKHKSMIEHTKTKYYRRLKRKFVSSAQEFYVTTLHHTLPTKTFRDCVFAYLPSDENHVFTYKPWKSHEFRDMSKRESCF